MPSLTAHRPQWVAASREKNQVGEKMTDNAEAERGMLPMLFR